MARNLSVSDITIKITDEKADLTLSFRRKIELSKMLDRLGLSVIECGPILNGRKDCLLVKSLASAIKNSTLAVPVDITRPESVAETWSSLKEAAHPRIQVCVPVSTVQMEYLCHKKSSAIIQLISGFVGAAKALCPEVEFMALDFGRSERSFLTDCVNAAVEAGAGIVTVCDTAGDRLYDEFDDAVRYVKGILPDNVKLGVWCSNDMYMADSCTISAIRAGADEIKVSAVESSTASLCRISKILQVKSAECGVTSGINMTEIQRVVAQMRLLCEVRKKNHMSDMGGVVSDGSDISLSMHDDMETLTKAVESLGYELNEEDTMKVYDCFIRLASRGDNVNGKELDAIVASVAYQAPATYHLESYVINSGNIITATCHLRLKKDNEIIESVGLGDGPVDAAFLAIEKLVDRQYELDDFQIQSVTEGREALGETVVRLRAGGKLYSGRGLSTDIVGSSIMAYLNAVNKIVYEEA